MFTFFASYLKEKADLTEEELRQVEAVIHVKKLRKRQYLLQEGDICHYRSFITKGCLRLYRISQDGSEHILRFGIENYWISDYESYNTGNPSLNNIDALENSELILIEKKNFDTLLNAIPKLQTLKGRLDANNLNVSQNRVLSVISETAEEKYENFIKTYPQFNSRVPLHMIASFLGVSRETLTRIRRQNVKTSDD